MSWSRLIALAIVSASSNAGAGTVAGHVEAATSRWSADGDVIVTEATVRAPDGSLVTATQLGGSVDGVGMIFSHVPAPLAAGDRVALTGAAIAGRFPVAPGTATYGVQRTTRSQRPLWNETACLLITYATGTARDRAWKTIDQALVAWEQAASLCSGVDFKRAHALVPAARDGLYTVHFRDDRWCRPATETEPELCYPRAATAVTRTVFVDDPGDPRDGAILEADIELNAVDFELGVDGAPGTIDLASVATHEVGHALGLAHNCGTRDEPWPTDRSGTGVPSCDGASAAVTAATMFYRVTPGETSMRTLEPADRDGACGALRGVACTPEATGGCAAGGHGAGLVLLLLVPRRRRLQAGPRSC